MASRGIWRVLVLGGYGGFGERLCRRLANDGWAVLVAGRDGAKARALAAELTGAEGLVVDRRADLAPVLAATRPDLLIDAAGPFQDSDCRVIEACIAAGVHYLDLADGRDFVCGVGAFDAAARRAGVAIVSGASSVPALSGAVIRELAHDMSEVRLVELAISASTRGTTGTSVGRAALSYAGKRIALWRAGRWENGYGWHDLRRETYAVSGQAPLRRPVALAEVPDLTIWPAVLPGSPTTVFRAGPETGFQLIGLWLLSWLVRWGWLTTLSGWHRPLLALQRWSGRLGGKRSAMAVTVTGRTAQGPLTRRWTLLATDNRGPEIPVLAAQLLARRLRLETLPPGARHAGSELSLAEFRVLFAELRLFEDTTETAIAPLYRRILGERFGQLAAPVRDLHDCFGESGAEGTGIVTRGNSSIARLLCRIMGFPPAGEYPVHVRFSAAQGKERWTRSFGAHRFSSELSAHCGRLVERFGPLRFHFALTVKDGGIDMDLARWTLCGVPMPRFLAPAQHASEQAVGDEFAFDVPVRMPLIGPILHYRGRLMSANPD